MSNLEYYIELIGNKESFNLWIKKGDRFFGGATLFYNDRLCGTQWVIDDLDRTGFYSKEEIKDELESPLRKIADEQGEKLLSMEDKSPSEVLNYVKSILNLDRGKND